MLKLRIRPRIFTKSLQKRLFLAYQHLYKEVRIGEKVTICNSEVIPLNTEMYVVKETQTERVCSWGVVYMKAYLLSWKKRNAASIVAVPFPIKGCANQFIAWSIEKAMSKIRKEELIGINAEMAEIEKRLNNIIGVK